MTEVLGTAYVMSTEKRGNEGIALGRLLERDTASGVGVNVVFDPGSSPWTCYERILELSRDNDGDSRFLISIQDDVAVPNRFLTEVKKILKAAPDQIISFFNPTNKGYREAAESGKHIYRTKYNFWPQVHAFPRSRIDEFFAYSSENFPDNYYSEDGRIKKWFRDTKELAVFAVVPSLSQHLGAFRSSLSIPGRCGGKVRNSFNFDPSFDVSAVDWASEFADPFKTKEARGFIPYDGYKKSEHGDDLSLWSGKSGEKVKK